MRTLFASVALAALVCAAAAQAAPPAWKPETAVVRPGAPPPAKPAPPGDDGLAGGGFYIEADELMADQVNDIMIARGSVEARYNGRTLRAHEVDYDRKSGVITARGDVQILNPDGTAQFAQALTLDKDLSEGIAIGFSTRMDETVKIAAATAERSGARTTVLRRVIFTPCPVCADNKGKPPTWSIRASRVVEDREKKTLVFHDAVIQVKGIGIAYLPVFWAADPTADRKSGFLLPEITISGARGLSYEQPYYQVFSKSDDIIISPQLNMKVNPFLNVEYRKRFYSGALDIRAGVTEDRDFTSGGDKFGPVEPRSYVLASGLFDLTDTWQWGFTAERASDRLIFDKYSIGDVFIDRGLYAADDRRLISQLYAVRQDQDSYLSIAAISVQGLRPTDDQSTFPTIAPLIEARWDPTTPILGGRLRMQGSAVALAADQSLDDPVLPGIDSRRASVEANWRRTFIFPDGLRLDPFVDVRGDLYSLAHVPGVTGSPTVPQGFAVAGLNLSYPLVRRAGSVTWILEPMLQAAASPTIRQDPRIPDEDSQVFEFDDTNLFQADKSPGFDIYDGGQKLDVGGRATAILDDGRSASLLVGRSFRAEQNRAIPLFSGLRPPLSDIIFEADATPLANIRFFTRLRLNNESLEINRMEAGAAFETERVSGYVSYLQEQLSPLGQRVRSLDFRGEVYPLKHWGVAAYAIVDNGTWRRQDIGLVYRDDCIKVEVLYRHDETFNGTLGPSTSVVLRLSLATLGNSGYGRSPPPP